MPPLQIFLVEDNDDDVFALKWALRKLDVPTTLTHAANGREALDMLAQYTDSSAAGDGPLPDLVLLDLKLPFFSGHEILEWIRGRHEFDTVKVVILSGSDEARDHEKAEEAGANGYLVKPATPQHLGELLARK